MPICFPVIQRDFTTASRHPRQPSRLSACFYLTVFVDTEPSWKQNFEEAIDVNVLTLTGAKYDTNSHIGRMAGSPAQLRIHVYLVSRHRVVKAAVSMIGLLCPLNMSAQTLLLLVQRLLLLSPDAFAAHDHHDRLVACLFAVRRAARRLLPPLAFLRAELFSALAASRYRCHALLVVRLCLLARAENVALRDESRRVVCAAG